MAANSGGIKRKRKCTRAASYPVVKKCVGEGVSPVPAALAIDSNQGPCGSISATIEPGSSLQDGCMPFRKDFKLEDEPVQTRGRRRSPRRGLLKEYEKEAVSTGKTSFGFSSSEIDIDELLFSPIAAPLNYNKVEAGGSQDVIGREGMDRIVEGDSEQLAGDDAACLGGEMRNDAVKIANDGATEDVDATDAQRDDGEDFLRDLYPEDFSFSLDTSIYAPSSEPRNLKEVPATTSMALSKHGSGDESTNATSERKLMSTNDPLQNVKSVPVVSSVPCPDMAPWFPSSTASSSPPLLPLDSSEIHLLQTPSPPSCHTSTPFKANPHQSPSVVIAVEHMDYPDTFYGLPIVVQSLLEKHRGIKRLYEWQVDCLSLRSVHNGCNLIYSLPTSGGKTLVAELIIFRQLFINGKNALFILPFVSIVQEKVRELQPFANELGFAVEEYAANKGSLPPRKRRKRTVYIATIEKANSLANSLIELGRLGELGLCIADELHMVGDGTLRGATLEACIAKIRFATKGHIQLVGMSATLSNITELATFLRAQIYTSSFRPVELREYVKLGRSVFSVSIDDLDGTVTLHPEREVSDLCSSSSSLSRQQRQLDPDQLCRLVAEVVPHDSCLVFCPTKKNCQNVALLLSSGLPTSVRFPEDRMAARRDLLQLLAVEASGVCPVLRQTIPSGVAYHHSGLTADERKVIEEGYLNGTLSILACTSTLAAGVNLPAKRVILRSPCIGNRLLTRSQYKQMVGRAGRSGMCASGESILVLQESDKSQVMEILSGPCERCGSSLLVDDCAAFLSLVLSLIGLKLVMSFHQLWEFLSYTLLCLQTESDKLKECCQQAVETLVSMGYVTQETGAVADDSSFLITTLGRASYKGSLSVKLAHVIYEDLKEACKSLVLTSDLHLLYLATPPDLSVSEYVQPNWMVYFEKVTGCAPDELQVALRVGVDPGTLSKKATGTAEKMSVASSAVYTRFYLTIMLHSLLKLERVDAIWEVAHIFSCSRGFLQTLLNSASSFASCLVHFTQEIPDFWSLTALLPAVAKKLSYSSRLELVSLLEISGLKQGRARQLVSVDINTPQALAAMDPYVLCEQVDHLYPKQARRLVMSAKALLSEQAEALLEEAEELMALVPDTADK